MTRTEIIVAAVIILLAAWLLMPPPVAPAPATPGTGLIDPCPYWAARTESGHWQPMPVGCTVFLPAVVNCNECASAWPIMPDAEVSKP